MVKLLSGPEPESNKERPAEKSGLHMETAGEVTLDLKGQPAPDQPNTPTEVTPTALPSTPDKTQEGYEEISDPPMLTLQGWPSPLSPIQSPGKFELPVTPGKSVEPTTSASSRSIFDLTPSPPKLPGETDPLSDVEGCHRHQSKRGRAYRPYRVTNLML